MSQLQAAVLAPIQEGMQSVPDSQVRNAGSNLLRKVNLMDFKAALKKRMLEETTGSTEDSLKAAVTSIEKAKEANKKIQDQGTAFMEKFAIAPRRSRPGRRTSNTSWSGASFVRLPPWTGTRSRTPRTCSSTTSGNEGTAERP